LNKKSRCRNVLPMQDRIVRLSSGVAVIRVGGSTEVEMTERKHRIEDALEAVKSAQEEGIIGGGGSSLLRAARSLDTGTEDLAASDCTSACEAPIRQMAANAGLSADIIIKDILNEEDGMGWNFRDNEMVDLFECRNY
jgi:chaperonin GroEL